MVDLLLIAFSIGLWFKRTRLASLILLASWCLIFTATEAMHFRIGGALIFGLAAFLYLHRLRKDLASRKRDKPFDYEAEERAERAYSQMKRWLSQHSRHWPDP